MAQTETALCPNDDVTGSKVWPGTKWYSRQTAVTLGNSEGKTDVTRMMDENVVFMITVDLI